jgi:hypothetical protein
VAVLVIDRGVLTKRALPQGTRLLCERVAVWLAVGVLTAVLIAQVALLLLGCVQQLLSQVTEHRVQPGVLLELVGKLTELTLLAELVLVEQVAELALLAELVAHVPLLLLSGLVNLVRQLREDRVGGRMLLLLGRLPDLLRQAHQQAERDVLVLWVLLAELVAELL